MKVKFLAISISMVSSGTLWAQDLGSLEEVEITGIRGSLHEVARIKHDANGVVDAVSAEDIGKLPDTNLAESLQRISGVSIDRKNGEGNQITVRGFGPSFNLVTLNGRNMPFADSPKQEGAGGTQNRSFNFEQIAPESVVGVDVYKTARAEQASGGIGAIVNVRTAKPFDYDGFKSAFSVKTNNDTTNVQGDDFTPELSGMFSTQLFDSKAGVLAAVSHSERDSSQEIIASDGWLRQTVGNCELGFSTSKDSCGGNAIDDSAIDAGKNPDGTIWLPQNYNMDVSHHERVRDNAQVVLQYAVSDTAMASLDYFYSKYTDDIERYQTAYWFGNWVTGGTDENGTIAQIVNGAGGTDYIGYIDEVETENESIGFNFEWDLSDNIVASFDIHHSTSHAQPDGNLSEKSILLSNADFYCATYEQCYAGQFTVDYGQGTDLPILNDPASMAENGFDGNVHYLYDGAIKSEQYDLASVGGNLVIGRGNEVLNTIDQAKLDFDWVNSSDSLLKSAQFGVGYVDFEFDTTWRMNMTTLGRAWNPSVDQLELVSSAGTGGTFSGNEALFPYFLEFDVKAMYNQIGDEFGFTFNPEVYNIVTEKTTSAYSQFNFESEIARMPLILVAGLRYEITDVTGETSQVTPYALRYESLTELRPQYTEDLEYGSTQLDGDYAYWLPNIDARLDITEQVVARASLGRTLTRTDLTALRPAVSIANSRPSGPYLAYQGNADLKPYLADNLDLSLEWYYADGSYVAVNHFQKRVDNYVSNDTTSGLLYNADGVAYTDPSQGDLGNGCGANGEDIAACDGTEVANSPEINWLITTPVNKGDSHVSGFELAIQHMFGESGFGMQANATLVDGDLEYDVFETTEQLALNGLSDSYNLVGFYDKNGFQVRLAYNWRDDFLASTDQLRAPDEPVFTEAYGQWDLGASYDISESMIVFLEGLNVTGEDFRQHGRFSNMLVSAQEFGPRYSIGIRVKF